ncbi:MAG: RimK family alpha-L-glutamate ligase [Nanoarchaeota archaeon]|nr:RimK family alpha-L-glutamate ligase [Nanoarchaeota archaeon]MBU1135654.1 RimK family alpha-L-glutamate ligase [Nanoarchaeota archaeon]MBU2520019.1 RimK family alpha-L-glutamate ligase [Nanoarchaeota archaeon]
MKLAILGPSENVSAYTTKRLIEEARKEMKVKQIPLVDVELKIDKSLDAIHEKESLSEYDYILPRIDSKRAEIGYPVVRFLDHMEVKKPYVAETILIAHNKFLTLEQFVKNGISVPETYLTASKNIAKDILGKQKFPIILKLLSGFGGQGVMVMDTKEAAETVIEAMKTLQQKILIEKFIVNPGEDIRGIVAGDEVIASFKRIALNGERRANIKLGGRGVAFKLSDEMEDICIKCARAIKSEICAVDMIEGKDGIQVIEVNINPGLQGIEKATNINVAQRIIDFVKSEIKR